MKMGFALALSALTLLTLGAGAADSPVDRIEIVQNYADAFEHEARQAYKSKSEFAYCLFGDEEKRETVVGKRRVLVISAALRPKQSASSAFKQGRFWHMVRYDACPPGTAADLHVHPFPGDFVFSELDFMTWHTTSYRYHFILFPLVETEKCEGDECVRIQLLLWWFQKPDEIRIVRDYGVTPWAGAPTAR